MTKTNLFSYDGCASEDNITRFFDCTLLDDLGDYKAGHYFGQIIINYDWMTLSVYDSVVDEFPLYAYKMEISVGRKLSEQHTIMKIHQ